MILYYPLSPVHVVCTGCDGFGWVTDQTDGLIVLCKPCDGLGHVWAEGGPAFGCKMTLGDRRVGEVVTLGNGDRGRIVRHCRRGEPSTEIALIDDMFETESETTTSYPSATGVRSTMPGSARRDDPAGEARSRRDQLDPLQRETRPL